MLPLHDVWEHERMLVAGLPVNSIFFCCCFGRVARRSFTTALSQNRT